MPPLSFENAVRKHHLFQRDISVENRPSQRSNILEEINRFAQKILHNQLYKNDYSALDESLRKTYFGKEGVERVGSSLGKDVQAIILEPNIPDAEDALKLRVKYAVNATGLSEIWKCAQPAIWLNRIGKLGYSTLRDWGNQELPFYLVELNGHENGASVLQGGEETGEGTKEMLNFFGEYFFPEKDEQNNLHTIQKRDAVIKNMKLFKDSMCQVITEYTLDAAIRDERVKKFESMFVKHINPEVSPDLDVGYILGDASIGNIINFTNGKKYHFAWTDQGFFRNLFGPEYKQEDIELANYGLPMISLGAFLMSIHPDLESRILSGPRKIINDAVEEFVHNNMWLDKQIVYGSSDSSWSKELKKKTINLGLLWYAIRLAKRREEAGWSKLVDRIFENIASSTLDISLSGVTNR